MKHSTPRDSANRHGNSLSRATLEAADDTKLVQEARLRLFHEEQQDTVEHFHQYGFTSVAKKPTGSGAMRKTAEAILAFLGGNRSHGVVLMIGDRRFRLNNLAEGEVAVHDDQGNQVYFSRDKIIVSGVKEVHVQVSDSHLQCTPAKVKMQCGMTSVTATDKKVFLGKEGVLHAVVTVDGPSAIVFASILEKDSPMTAAVVAKQTAPTK